MSTYTARATREDGWWTVTVDEVPGLFTQTKRLDQIKAAIRDALVLFPEIEVEPEAATVTIKPTGEYGQLSHDVLAAREQAREYSFRATNLARATAIKLYNDGLPYRDIGELLGVSFQRAQSLVAG